MPKVKARGVKGPPTKNRGLDEQFAKVRLGEDVSFTFKSGLIPIKEDFTDVSFTMKELVEKQDSKRVTVKDVHDHVNEVLGSEMVETESPALKDLRGKVSTFSPGKSGALTSGNGMLAFIWQTPLSFLDSLARRVERGAKPKDEKDPYPIFNWRQGLSDPKFIRARFGNFVRHAFKVANCTEDDEDGMQDNIDACTWFCMFINEANRVAPEAVREAFYSEPRGERYD